MQNILNSVAVQLMQHQNCYCRLLIVTIVNKPQILRQLELMCRDMPFLNECSQAQWRWHRRTLFRKRRAGEDGVAFCWCLSKVQVQAPRSRSLGRISHQAPQVLRFNLRQLRRPVLHVEQYVVAATLCIEGLHHSLAAVEGWRLDQAMNTHLHSRSDYVLNFGGFHDCRK